MSEEEYKHDDGDDKNNYNVPVTVIEKIVQEFEKLNQMVQSSEQRNIDSANRLAGLITVANFESTLTERMIQNKYYGSDRSKSTYEELRRTIARTMAESIEKSDTTEVLQLNEKVGGLETDLEKLHKEMEALKQRESLLQKKCTELAERHKEAADALKAYSALVKWHEKRDREAPAMRKRNSGLIFKQSLEEALAEFEQSNPKPKVSEVNS